jgi:hypothetical protein
MGPFGSQGRQTTRLSIFFLLFCCLPVSNLKLSEKIEKNSEKVIYDNISYGIKRALLDVASLKNLRSRDKEKEYSRSKNLNTLVPDQVANPTALNRLKCWLYVLHTTLLLFTPSST